jgi:hypothetical protein
MLRVQIDVYHEGAMNLEKICEIVVLSIFPCAFATPLAFKVALNKPPTLHKVFTYGNFVGLIFLVWI